MLIFGRRCSTPLIRSEWWKTKTYLVVSHGLFSGGASSFESSMAIYKICLLLPKLLQDTSRHYGYPWSHADPAYDLSPGWIGNPTRPRKWEWNHDAYCTMYQSILAGLMTHIPRGVYSHVKAYGDVSPKWVTFLEKSLDMGPILFKKILRRGSHFTKIAKKNGKNQPFLR